MTRHSASNKIRTTMPMLVAAGGAMLAVAMARPTVAQAPDVIYITGTVRDFQRAHPDFNVTPSGGNGHYAGNVSLTAGDNHPSFAGVGYRVSTQWTDRNLRNMAPHLHYDSGVLKLASAPTYNPALVTIDTWNSTAGSYGGGNVGPQPPMQWPATMPSVSAPTGLSPYPGAGNVNTDVSLVSGVHLLALSFRCRGFAVGSNSIINVAANTNLTMYCTGAINIGQNTQIIVPSTSTLRIYFSNAFGIGQSSQINMLAPLNPARCQIYNLSNQTMIFNQQGKVCAQIVSPGGSVHLKQGDEFFGTVVARTFQLDQGSALHWDGIPVYVCGSQIIDNAGVRGVNSAGGISSASSLAQWFNDTSGVNLSASHSIALTRNGAVYEYLNDAFFPIDGRMFGNEGDAHNYYFTFNFDANFVHDQCSGGYLEFTGADDVWVYINGQLVMDLGGILPMTTQIVDIDRLNLTAGQTYKVHFHYAQRNPNMAVFRMRTNLQLESSSPLTVTAMFD